MNEHVLLHHAGDVLGCQLSVRASTAGCMVVPANWFQHRGDRFWNYARRHMGLSPTGVEAVLALIHLHGRWTARHSASYSTRGTAASWLAELLLEYGSLPYPQVQRIATAAGFPWSTVRKSALRIGVVKVKSAFNGPWVWSMPTEATRSHRQQGSRSGWISDSEPRTG